MIINLFPEGNRQQYFNWWTSGPLSYIWNTLYNVELDGKGLRIAFYSTESPAIHTIHPAYQLVNETDTFEFFCNATGNPPPTITWRKVGDTRKVHSLGQTLVIHNAYKSDFGSYRCTAMSVRGENVSAVARVEMDNCESNFCLYCSWSHEIKCSSFDGGDKSMSALLHLDFVVLLDLFRKTK